MEGLESKDPHHLVLLWKACGVRAVRIAGRMGAGWTATPTSSFTFPMPQLWTEIRTALIQETKQLTYMYLLSFPWSSPSSEIARFRYCIFFFFAVYVLFFKMHVWELKFLLSHSNILNGNQNIISFVFAPCN